MSADKGEAVIVVPSIVLMECLYICERNKVELTFKDIAKVLNAKLITKDEKIIKSGLVETIWS
ncbi:MAG: hypothetical protein B5M48_02215 [Candidatus Omnitrophica bacterium 4484_213]|nr:MAG: hypothetical protein B5M48_02215 [Candidatus Omnitrophica bacterium 4484_213]